MKDLAHVVTILHQGTQRRSETLLHRFGMQALMERFDELLSTSRDKEKEQQEDSQGDVKSSKHDHGSSRNVSRRKQP